MMALPAFTALLYAAEQPMHNRNAADGPCKADLFGPLRHILYVIFCLGPVHCRSCHGHFANDQMLELAMCGQACVLESQGYGYRWVGLDLPVVSWWYFSMFDSLASVFSCICFANPSFIYSQGRACHHFLIGCHLLSCGLSVWTLVTLGKAAPWTVCRRHTYQLLGTPQ